MIAHAPTDLELAAALKNFPEANFLQSPEWGKVNEKIGHKIVSRIFIKNDKTFGLFLGIIKDAKRGRYIEIPGGPLWDKQIKGGDKFIFTEIRKIAKQEKCVFVRFRPQFPENETKYIESLGAVKSPMHLHAEHTVMIDLSKSEEELLESMRRQTRYEVRRAEKLGLQTAFSDSAASYDEFYALQAATAKRQGFIPPSRKLLLAEREVFADEIRLYSAKTAEGETVAMGLIIFSGEEAGYFEAASSNLARKLPGAYALQWQVIKDLKALGVKRYNLFGIAPPNAKNHRFSGVTTFKTGFGGEVISFVSAHDLVINPAKYAVNYLVETIRRKLRHL
jgi:lipid II:glycine glycyltransferase (peptidoglycan interpeptide bridge formation enzyme)